MNFYGVKAIYMFELSRFLRTLLGSLATPVISTSLYFIVFLIKGINICNYENTLYLYALRARHSLDRKSKRYFS